MDPRALFYQQIDLLFENASHLADWLISKDAKNNIIAMVPPEWVVHSQFKGVSLQATLNVQGELVLSIGVENPIPLQQRGEFKQELYKLFKESGLFQSKLIGFETNLNQRGKFIKKTLPLLSDSYEKIVSFTKNIELLIPDVKKIIAKYKDLNLLSEPKQKSIPKDPETQNQTEEVVFDDGDADYQMEYTPERKIFTHKAEYSVEFLHKKTKRGKLNLQPDFQRHFVWDKIKSSNLIESLLLDVPIPVIYLAEDEDGSMSVIDGQQRLCAVFSFIDGQLPDGKQFKLNGLKILRDLNQKSFAELDESYQDKLEATTLSTITIKKESDTELRFEIFERLNTGSVKLNDQELRNCIFRGRYLELLKELSSEPDYKYIMGFKNPDKRMKDVEYVLHFGAFYHQTYLKYNKSLSNFLNNEMKQFRDINKEDEQDLIAKFRKAVQINKSLFGNRSFRRIRCGDSEDPNATWKNTTVINAALYDVMMTSFLNIDKNVVYRNLDAIREAIIYLLTENQEFIDTIEKWTSRFDQIKKRFEIFNKTINDILATDSKQERCFSYQLKEHLFKENNTCALCGQNIYMIDDAAVDHIEQYWLGGKTVPQNARLAHRYCNAKRPRKETNELAAVADMRN